MESKYHTHGLWISQVTPETWGLLGRKVIETYQPALAATVHPRVMTKIEEGDAVKSTISKQLMAIWKEQMALEASAPGRELGGCCSHFCFLDLTINLEPREHLPYLLSKLTYCEGFGFFFPRPINSFGSI